MTEPGSIVILNGAPRAGKSTIVAAIQAGFEGPWMNLGVDVFARQVTPLRYQPGMGLRPGGERPDLERLLPAFFGAFYDSVAAHSRHGLNVVVDVGHHDDYSTPLHLLRDAARRLQGLPVLFVGVRCPLSVIMERRGAADGGLESAGKALGTAVPEPVLSWQDEVHIPGIYDLEVDTGTMSPEQCVLAIQRRLLEDPPPTAFARLAEES